MRKLSLTNNQLKIIAAIIMVIDHVGMIFFPMNKMWRVIGRLAFPIFAFCMVEGWFHTRSKLKYILTLTVFGLVSEIPYDLATKGVIFSTSGQNIMWTFCFCGLYFYAEEFIKEKMSVYNIGASTFLLFRVIMLSVGMFFITELLCLDYGYGGFLTVFSFYYIHEASEIPYERSRRFYMITGTLLFCITQVFIIGSTMIAIGSMQLPIQAFGMLALPVLRLYNGKRGRKLNVIKYGFYVFYPLHLLALYGVFLLSIT